jgi:ABC-type Mn2+/Zn2+ transport system ATPase subunit
MLVEVVGARFGYGSRTVVRAGQLRLRAADCLGIFGPNGSGKSTLVKGITGLIRPIDGEVRHAAVVRFGYLPQHRAMELHWPMSGIDAAGLAVSARRRFGWIGADVSRLRERMRLLGVEDLARRSFAQLSGGQQQRLLLAGALAAEPNVLVLDEPTDGLDLHSRQILLDTLKAEAARGLCVVLVSHEIDDLVQVCQTVADVRPGGEEGQPSHAELISPRELSTR